MSSKVMKPWTPLEVNENGNTVDVSLWGRKYQSGDKSFLQSVISQNTELLAEPVRFVGIEDGNECVWDSWRNFPMYDHDETQADIGAVAQTDVFLINTSMHIEYDGCIELKVRVAPRGRTVAEGFGLAKIKVRDYNLERLWLEIPLKEECAKYFQHFSQNAENGALSTGGILDEYKALTFKEQIFLSNDNVGFLFFMETPENFAPFYNDKAIEIIKKDGKVLLRIRIFDMQPYQWKEHTQANGMYMHPIEFKLGITVTPVKEMPERVFDEKAVHIDCFKKIPNDYEEFLSEPFEGTDEITFDRLQRLGVNTLYLHEKWNDMQNSPIITSRTARRLRYIVEEAHKRGIKVAPYFGYEMSTLAPYFNDFYHEYHAVDFTGNIRWHWYRQPPQRAVQVCQKSGWSEFFTSNIEKLIDEFGFDGVYLDGTPYVRQCMNTAHGCGVYDPDGKLCYTYPVWGTRKTMKKLYEIIVEKRGGFINCHAGSAFNIPALTFSTSLWDGEAFQSEFLHGKLKELPDEYFRGLYTGRNIGIPIYMLCYLNPPVWTFNNALATTLPFGIIPKSNDAGEPLEVMSKIWKIYDEFDVEAAKWYPYYGDDKPKITCSDSDVKMSVYQYDDKLLAICATIKADYDGEFEINSEFSEIKNAMTGESLSSNGCVKLNLKGFDYVIIEAKK